MIKIIIADDHKIFRQGLVALLSSESDLSFVGEASNGYELMHLLSVQCPDVLLLDIQMPQMDGMDVASKIKNTFPKVKTIVLTSHDKSAYVRLLLRLGVHGYLLKDTDKSELVEAIHHVIRGETYFSSKIMQSVMENIRSPRKNDTLISAREIEIIKLISMQHTTPEIAGKLHLSPKTIETHRKNILLKLNLRNSAGLVRFAVQKGWVE